MIEDLPVRQHPIPDGNQIQIKRPRTPARLALSPVRGFDLVQDRQNFDWAFVRS